MGHEFALDFAKYQYWAALGLALCVLPAVQGRRREVGLFFINSVFLWLMLGPQMLAIPVLAYLLSFSLRRMSSRNKVLLSSGIGVFGLILFFVHKRPRLFSEEATMLNPVLAVVGFSYVALRLVELVRAVYEEREPAPDFVTLYNYLVPFHMLAAGPIQSYSEFLKAHPGCNPEFEDVVEGLSRISWGLLKKFVFAKALQVIFLTGFTSADPYYLVLEAQVYFLWLYLDFSGYTDLAVGAGKLMGFQTPENFNNPLMARDLIEFWERWHMSLSRWIRVNLFTPLQLNVVRRVGVKYLLTSAVVGFFVSFTLCGLWHNPDLNWFLWGTTQGIGLSLCKVYQTQMTNRYGRKGRRKYMEIAWIRWFMILVTYEFNAFSLVLSAWPGKFF